MLVVVSALAAAAVEALSQQDDTEEDVALNAAQGTNNWKKLKNRLRRCWIRYLSLYYENTNAIETQLEIRFKSMQTQSI